MRNKIYLVLLIGVIGAVIYGVVAQKKRNADYAEVVADVAATGQLGIAYESAVKIEVGLDTNTRYVDFNPGDTVLLNGTERETSNTMVEVTVFPEDQNLKPFKAEWYYPNLPVANIDRIAVMIENNEQKPFAVKYKKSQTEAGKYTVAELTAEQFEKEKPAFDKLEQKAKADSTFWPGE